MASAKNIFGIFAHPDDEAFGPSGIIANWSKTQDVYIICVTDGSHPNGGIKKLGKIRRKELENSAKILGVKKVFFLGYTDGELRNNIYHKVAKDIEKILAKFKPEIILTLDEKGISGHIDHIFVSMVVGFLFRDLRYIKKVYYLFRSKKEMKSLSDNYFIYVPAGYNKNKADHVEDVSGVWDKKINAIKAHVSQKKDGERILKRMKHGPKKEYFFVRKRESNK